MAKYYGSTWGLIKGKVGDAVGATTRGGIRVVKAYRKTEDKKSIKKVLTGEIKIEEVSVRHVNHSYCAFPLASHIARKTLHELIFPVWEPLTKGKPISGVNLFTKVNVPRLYHSIPYPTKFYGLKNMPKMDKLLLSEGRHEPIWELRAQYDKESGEIMVEWATVSYSTGSKEDLVYVIVIYWWIGETQNELPDLQAWKNVKIWGSGRVPVANRGEGRTKISIDKGLTMKNAQLVVYAFCRNSQKEYSTSNSYLITT